MICGSGLDNLELFFDGYPSVKLLGPVDTPFGMSSDLIVAIVVDNIEVVLLARHGQNHAKGPSFVNYRANLFALVKKFRCEAIVSSSTCAALIGSQINSGDLCIYHDFMDFTSHGGGIRGPYTFFDGKNNNKMKGIFHAPMNNAFSKDISEILANAAQDEGFKVHVEAVCVTVEGPRLPSPSELKMYRTLGANVADQTTVPEVILAKELGIPYAVLGMVTDTVDERDSLSYLLEENEALKKNAMHCAPLFVKTILKAIPSIGALKLKQSKISKFFYAFCFYDFNVTQIDVQGNFNGQNEEEEEKGEFNFFQL